MAYFRRIYIYLVFSLCALFCVAQSGQAQDISDFSQLKPEDYTKITLPPLDRLFENAKGGPTYELSLLKEQIEKKLLAKEKRAVLSFFSLRGSYQYGMFGNERTFTDVSTPAFLEYTSQAQNGYTVGAGINIPLDALFDLKPRVKRQKLNIRAAELEREIKFEEMKKEIIQLYATATAQLNILRLNAEALILANVQYNITARDFSNGIIDSGVLSTEKGRQSVAQEKFENSKFELSKSLMVLEVITRTPILNNK